MIYYFNEKGNTGLILSTIYISLFFIAFQSAFFSPASSALIPQIIDEECLVSASSLFQLTRSLQNILGLALGAYLYVNFGIIPLIILNGISFILSAISEINIRFNVPKNQHKLSSEAYTLEKLHSNTIVHYVKRIYFDLKESAAYLFKDAKAIAAVVIIMIISLTLLEPYQSVAVPYIIKEHFTFSSILPDFILASIKSFEAIGVIVMSIIVALYIAQKAKIYTLLRIASVSYLLIGIITVIAIVGYDQSFISEKVFILTFFSVYCITGLTGALINAPFNASIAKYVDPNKIGKVVSMMESFGGLLMPLSLIVFGLLIDNVSIYIVVILMLIAYILIMLVIFVNKNIKSLK